MIQKLALDTEMSQASTAKFMDAFIYMITDSLMSGRSLNVRDLGSFSLSKRQGREWYNPATWNKMLIEAMNTVKFKACAPLKRWVKNIGI